ncbi:MAG: 4-hydroxy-tetrahydrodipicolinate reductase [Micrococcales bacterium]
MTIKVSVIGATGRMGKLALELIDAAQDFSLHSALDSKSELTETIGADVIFDVTNLEVSKAVAQHVIAHNQKVLIGTSGWSALHLDQLKNSLEGSTAAVVVVPNFSIGSMLATKFAAEAAKFFDSIEIVEAHHAGKVDSPSGTAIRTAELISDARDAKPILLPGVGQQARGQVVAGVPVHSLRLSGVSAKQDVILGGESELLTLSHETTSVKAYSAGILEALRFASTARGLTVGLQAVLGL